MDFVLAAMLISTAVLFLFRCMAQQPSTFWSALEAIGTISAAIVALLIAVFGDVLRSLHMKPRLGVSLDLRPPDCQKMTMQFRFQQSRYHRGAIESSATATVSGSAFAPAEGLPGRFTAEEEAPAYYLRLRVRNCGREKAESVEVFAAALSEKQDDGTFEPVTSFLPMNLRWTHYRNRVFLPALSPGTFKHCDLAFILEPAKRNELSAQYPNWAQHNYWDEISSEEAILSLVTVVRPLTRSHLVPPGTYRLELVVAASNVKALRTTFEMVLTGEWYPEESRMLGQGIRVRRL